MANDAVRSRQNVTLTYNGEDLTDYMNNASLDAALNQIEATVFSSTGVENLVDSTTWTIQFSGYWDATLDGYLAPDVITPGTIREAVIGFKDASGATVTYTWDPVASSGEQYAMLQNFNVSAAIGSLLAKSNTLAVSGAPTRAVA